MSQSRACRGCGCVLPAESSRSHCSRCSAATGGPPTASFGGPRPAAEARRSEPAATASPAEILRALRDLALVAPQELESSRLTAITDSQELARALVESKMLTSYQAGALLQGKARGLLIGNYLILDKLGSGGMGVVFKARHRASQNLVALKMLPPSFARDADALRRFDREFLVASRLSHPNLVAAIESSADRGVHFLTMEYVPGHDLERLVAAGGPMSVKLALHCVTQAARGLEAAHAQGVIHRDVKPGNLMIDPGGTIRVLDLGLARVLESASGFSTVKGGSLTHTGAYMGTVDYLAPEQANDARQADGRADIYSLGCTLYFLLTGQPPFPAETVLRRLIAHQERPAPSLRAARPEVGEGLDRVYQRMLAKRPEDRPQSVSKLILELESCRANVREAGDAAVDLLSFARTALKRAPEKKRRGPDASVFARPAVAGPLVFDPDLNLQDLVGDYRDEIAKEELAEDKLPPAAPRLAGPVRKRRRTSPLPVYAVVGLLGLAGVGFALTRVGNRVEKSTAVKAVPAGVLPHLAGPREGVNLKPRVTTLGGSSAGEEQNTKQTIKGNRDGILFEDDYNTPQKYWTSTSPEVLAKHPEHRWGHTQGIFFDEVRADGHRYYGTLPGGPYEDFEFETLARIVGDNPRSRGTLSLLISGGGHSFTVKLDGHGAVYIHPDWDQDSKGGSGPWIGPLFNPAIHPGGGEFNTITIRCAKRQAQILVNGAAVCEPLLFDAPVVPAQVRLGVTCEVASVRTEFEKVTIRKWTPTGSDTEVAGKSIRVGRHGGARLPDGTWVFEGGYFDLVNKTGAGAIYPQTDMENFPAGVWSNHRQMFWNGPRPGDACTLSLPIEEPGNYEVAARFTRSFDYGRAQLEINGQPLMDGQYIDLYNPDVIATDLMRIGFVKLEGDRAQLSVKIAGKSRASGGYNFGLDEIRLIPVR